MIDRSRTLSRDAAAPLRYPGRETERRTYVLQKCLSEAVGRVVKTHTATLDLQNVRVTGLERKTNRSRKYFDLT